MRTAVTPQVLVTLGIVVLSVMIIPAAFADDDVSSAPAESNTVTVSAQPGSAIPGCEETNECFMPHTVTIKTGGTVTWKNSDSIYHTVGSGIYGDGGADGTFESSLFAAGEEFSHTFMVSGEYPYYCTVHPWMDGVVIVQDETDDATSGSLYTNVQNNFAVEFPNEWDILDIGGIHQTVLVATGPETGIAPPSITIFVEASGDRTLDSIRDEKIPTLNGTFDGRFEVLTHDIINISGTGALVRDMQETSDTANVMYREVTLVSSGFVYTLQFSANTDDFDVYVRAFDNSLESFTILIPKGDVAVVDTSPDDECVHVIIDYSVCLNDISMYSPMHKTSCVVSSFYDIMTRISASAGTCDVSYDIDESVPTHTDGPVLLSGSYHVMSRTLTLSFGESVTLSKEWQNGIQLQGIGPDGNTIVTPDAQATNHMPDGTSMAWITLSRTDGNYLEDITDLTVTVEPDTFTNSNGVSNGFTTLSIIVLR